MNLPIIDTHQHLWDPSQFSYSWMEGFPAIRRKAMLGEYRLAAGDASIIQTVYVDTDVDDKDLAREAEAIFALADTPGSRIGGIVAGARLERSDFFHHLEKFDCHPKLKGLRRVLHTQPDELSQSTLFRENLRSLSARGLSFDLCVLARQLPSTLDLVRHCPDVSFILDHCGIPDVKGEKLDPWRQDIHALAQQPNLVCKISGLVAYADPSSWRVEDLRPFFDHVIDCFGWERVMWGSDWPVCTLNGSLSQWITATHNLVASATPAQREQFFSRNAVRIYRLENL